MFNRKRIKEWRRVVKYTKPSPLHWLKMIWGLARLIFGRKVDRKQWRHRMQTCYICPIYDPIWKRCRPYNASNLGCGCYTPYSNMVGKNCWGRTSQGKPFGWGE